MLKMTCQVQNPMLLPHPLFKRESLPVLSVKNPLGNDTRPLPSAQRLKRWPCHCDLVPYGLVDTGARTHWGEMATRGVGIGISLQTPCHTLATHCCLFASQSIATFCCCSSSSFCSCSCSCPSSSSSSSSSSFHTQNATSAKGLAWMVQDLSVIASTAQAKERKPGGAG